MHFAKHTRVAIALYVLWILLLLLAGVFEGPWGFRHRFFKDVAFYSFLFFFTAWFLYRWVGRASNAVSATPPSRHIASHLRRIPWNRIAAQFTLPPTTNKYRFYGMRIGLLLIIALGLLIVLTGLAVRGVISHAQLSNWWLIIFVFASTATFSQPIGFCRKLICVGGSLFAYIFLTTILLKLLVFMSPDFSSGFQPSAFEIHSTISNVYSLLDAVLFGMCFWLLVRWMKRWRRIYTQN
jgi:hypothetical protein